MVLDRGCHEVLDRSNKYEDGNHGYGEQQLESDDCIDLADEGPPKLRALEHHRIGRRPGLNISS